MAEGIRGVREDHCSLCEVQWSKGRIKSSERFSSNVCVERNSSESEDHAEVLIYWWNLTQYIWRPKPTVNNQRLEQHYNNTIFVKARHLNLKKTLINKYKRRMCCCAVYFTLYKMLANRFSMFYIVLFSKKLQCVISCLLKCSVLWHNNKSRSWENQITACSNNIILDNNKYGLSVCIRQTEEREKTDGETPTMRRKEENTENILFIAPKHLNMLISVSHDAWPSRLRQATV